MIYFNRTSRIGPRRSLLRGWMYAESVGNFQPRVASTLGYGILRRNKTLKALTRASRVELLQSSNEYAGLFFTLG